MLKSITRGHITLVQYETCYPTETRAFQPGQKPTIGVKRAQPFRDTKPPFQYAPETATSEGYIGVAKFFRASTIYSVPLQPKVLRIDNDNVPESASRAVPQVHMCAALSTHTIAIFAWQRALNCSCYSDPAMGDRAAFGEYSRPCIETQDARRRSDDLAHVSGRPAHVDRSSPQGLEAS